MPRPTRRIEPNTALYEHLQRSQEGKRKMAALVERYGLDVCRWALDQIRAEKAEQERLGIRRVGRKKDYDPDALRDLWVFVEARRTLKKQSVSTFCEKAKFAWIEGGRNGVKVAKEISGATLRRRYQEAARYLKDASAPFEHAAKRGVKSPRLASISPEEQFWRRLVAEEMARLRGNGG